VLGVLAGGPGNGSLTGGSDGSSGSSDGSSTGTGSSGSGGSTGGSTGSSSGGSSGSSPGTNTSGLDDVKASSTKGGSSANVQTAYTLLRRHGYTHEQACGILGNIVVESGGNLNPNAHNNIAGGHDGIAQWDSTRWANLQRQQGSKSRTLEGQVAFIVYELKHGEGKGVPEKMIQSKPNDVTTAAIGMAHFERFGPGRGQSKDQGFSWKRYHSTGNGYPSTNSDLRNRIAKAKELAGKLNGSSAGGGASSSSSSTASPPMTNFSNINTTLPGS
jgi:hypothetical protein